MLVLKNNNVELKFILIKNGYNGKLLIKLKKFQIEKEIVCDNSLFILDVLRNSVINLLDKNQIYFFNEHSELNDFSILLNYSPSINYLKKDFKLKSEIERHENKIRVLDLFNNLFFSIVNGEFYLTYYSNIIKDSDFKYIDEIKLQDINKFVKHEVFRSENFMLKKEELKVLLEKLNKLIVKVNKDVFNFIDWIPDDIK